MPLVTASQFDLQPSIGRGLAQGIQTLTQFQQLGQRNLQAQREAQVRELVGGALAPPEFAPQTQQEQMLAEQTSDIGGPLAAAEQPQPIMSQEEKIQLAKSIDPAIANKLLKDAGIDSASKRAEASRFAVELEGTPFEMRQEKIIARSQDLRAQGRDSTQTDQLLDMDEATQSQALLSVQLLDLTTKERFGVKAAKIKADKGVVAGASQREFESLIKDFTSEEKKKARRVKAGLEKRAVGSALQTISEEDTARKIADTKALIEGAVVEARIIAKDKGETFTGLSQARAALPGLKNTIEQLRGLSQIATSTIGGKIFNAAVKETGFGSTKGATARAKFIAIINNQVLPLLKPTFGAAFTVQEGEALKATMGDPDASPAEKMAQLDSFIDQKMRDIETKETALQEPQPAQDTQTVIRFNRQGQRIQ